MTAALVFPGQGSQSTGMQGALAVDFGEIQACYAEASDILGYDLWQLVQEGPADKLERTVITQPAMLTAGVAAWRAWRKAGGPMPEMMAGHSLGEYTALVCAGALDFTDALSVVRKRAQLMQEAVPAERAAMAAILGLDDAVLLDICDNASTVGLAEAVNFNSPGQVVVAGHREGVQQVIELAKERGAKRAILLHVSVPSHSSLMRPAGEALAEHLHEVQFRKPGCTVVSSVDVRPYTDGADMRELLTRQVFSPVRWVDTVRYLASKGVTSVVECGPGKVLTGLVRRIDKTIATGFIESPDSLAGALSIQ